jgi:hypothetical protein
MRLNSFGTSDSQLELMKSNMTNIKTNLVGLGNYINNINGDLSQLLVSFDGYAKKMGLELSGIKANLGSILRNSVSAQKLFG